MFEKEKEIIKESFEFFLSGALEVIEADCIQRALYEALDDFKYGNGPGFIRLKRSDNLEDPCLWLLAKPHHPDEIAEEPDSQQRMIMSRAYEVVVVLERDGYAVKAVWDLLKPLEPNILHCSLVAQWVVVDENIIDVSEAEPGEDIRTIIYKNSDSFSNQL
jgi:hypothetical protein